MKVVALLSGGKDSIYNVMKCIEYGHEIVCVGNLRPAPTDVDELDSEMYQTVGWNGVELMAKALDLPFYFGLTHGTSIQKTLSYHPNKESKTDEVEDLLLLIQRIKTKHPQINAVSTGAILSNYQRNRVESVCDRLGLVNLSYLWQRTDQDVLLKEMIRHKIDAVIIKCASMGLSPNAFLGQSIQTDAIYDKLMDLGQLYQMNVCGEGGEYETFVVDCPLFKQFKISIDESSICGDLHDPIAPNGHLKFVKLSLVPKESHTIQSDQEKKDNGDGTAKTDCMFMEIQDCVPFTPPQMIESTNICNYGVNNGMFQFVAHPNVSMNSKYIEDLDLTSEVQMLFSVLQSKLKKYELSLDHLFYCQLFLNDMALFKIVNRIYKSYFKKPFPPSRVCCQLDLNMEHRVSLEALAYKYKHATQRNKHVFDCLHVQSISEWAPNCIGPYSQASKIANKFVFCAGMIGLVPATMKMVPNDQPMQQMDCTWNNTNAVLSAFDSGVRLAIHHNIFVLAAPQKDGHLLHVVQRAMEKHMSDVMDFNAVIVYVPDLPRHALMELQTLALTKSYINQLNKARSDANINDTNAAVAPIREKRGIKLKYAHIKKKKKKKKKARADICKICTDYNENEIGTFFMVKTKTIYNVCDQWCSMVSIGELTSQQDAHDICKVIKSALSHSVLCLNGYGFRMKKESEEGLEWTERCIVFIRLYYHAEALEPKALLHKIESCFSDIGISKIPAISLIPCRGMCFANHKDHNLSLYMLHCFLHEQQEKCLESNHI
eukprot:365158_1